MKRGGDDEQNYSSHPRRCALMPNVYRRIFLIYVYISGTHLHEEKVCLRCRCCYVSKPAYRLLLVATVSLLPRLGQVASIIWGNYVCLRIKHRTGHTTPAAAATNLPTYLYRVNNFA